MYFFFLLLRLASKRIRLDIRNSFFKFQVLFKFICVVIIALGQEAKKKKNIYIVKIQQYEKYEKNINENFRKKNLGKKCQPKSIFCIVKIRKDIQVTSLKLDHPAYIDFSNYFELQKADSNSNKCCIVFFFLVLSQLPT